MFTTKQKVESLENQIFNLKRKIVKKQDEINNLYSTCNHKYETTSGPDAAGEYWYKCKYCGHEYFR